MLKRKHVIAKPYLLAALICCLIIPLTTFIRAGAAEDENISLLDRSSKAFASIVKKAGPAVVHVRVEKSIQGRGAGGPDLFSDPFFERFFGPQFRHPREDRQPREYKQRAAGSGFIISHDGYILTNNHVVEDADKITVNLDDEREFKAEVIGTDPQSDVALIKVDAENLPILELGDSDKLEVGEWVIAIGSPFELNQSVTVGVVSAKGRNRMGISDYENFIQTDAAINPGNSGGPLLNTHGEVVGMNTAIFSRSGGYMGIGFAIPVNMAKAIKQQLLKHGKVTRGWLGVVIQDVNDDLAKSFGLENTRGALISEVSKNSPADKGGLKQGDVIMALDGTDIKDVADLRNKVAMIAPGAKVDVTVMREGKERKIGISIGEQPEDFAQPAAAHGDGSLQNMGLSLQNLTEELAGQFGYDEDQGVLIVEVEPDSPAEQAGLKAGQLIEEVNKQRVHNLKDLRTVLDQSKSTDKVLLRIRAGEYSQYVVLRSE